MFKHEHRWHFLQVRTEAQEAGQDGLFKKVEYAYYVCNDCPETNGEPNTIKRIVANRSNTDVEDSKES